MPELVLRTKGACQIDTEHLLQVVAAQRQRFAMALRGFAPEDWAEATRCPAWSAHEVVRHMCDIATVGIAMGPGDDRLDFSTGFDPRTAPARWMAVSAGESPDATLDRYTAISSELDTVARDRLAQDRRFDVLLPYGPMDWTVLWLHGFWDAWIHERDVLLARGAEHPTDGDAIAYAIAYGVFISAAVGSMFGAPVRETLTLGGDGGGVIDVDSTDGVTVTLSRAGSMGPRAAELVDALAGRAPDAAVLDDLPAGSRTGLMALADFFRTPVEP
jgi:uncharacterized protein (TIGR03083 family)